MSIDVEQILQDPATGTVDEVVEILADATPEQVEHIKTLEAVGKNRKGILDWQPAPDETAEPVDPDAVEISRFLDRVQGPRFLAGKASHPEIVGALDGATETHLTRDEVLSRVEKFRTRPIDPTDPEEA